MTWQTPAVVFLFALACSAPVFAQDYAVPADYNGDGQMDIGVARVGADYLLRWHIQTKTLSGATESLFVRWGVSEDTPVVGDYDGDGKADIAVMRRQKPGDKGAVWFIRLSSGGMLQVQWGLIEDVPVQADYDGDGRTDIAVYRSATDRWWILQSVCGFGCYSVRGPLGVPSPATRPASQ